MTKQNEYIERLETLINGTRARLDSQRTSGQDAIDAVRGQVEALRAELVPLPGQAKALRAQGLVRQSSELVQQIEELNIKIARLEVDKARLEADRLTEISTKFSAIIPEVSSLSREGALQAEQAKNQAQIDFETLLSYAQGIANLAYGHYGQPAAEANKRLNESVKRLNTAIEGEPTLAAVAAQAEPVVIRQRPTLVQGRY